MEKFISLKGTAVPLLVKNIDTDQIIPKQFLTTVKREGLSKGLFYDWRFDEDGLPQEEFVLNQKKYHNACVLLADDNFGCGSSREHAPWALLDFGIRCVIAPSFADIFANNCKKNGILTIKMSIEKINALLAATKQNDIEINLKEQSITAGALSYNFNIGADRKNTLLNGLDEIALTEELSHKIKKFEQANKISKPWL